MRQKLNNWMVTLEGYIQKKDTSDETKDRSESDASHFTHLDTENAPNCYSVSSDNEIMIDNDRAKATNSADTPTFTEPSLNLEILSARFTDQGKRDKNDDFGEIRIIDGNLTAVLCDGIGGAPFGDVAARIAAFASLESLEGTTSEVFPKYGWVLHALKSAETAVQEAKRLLHSNDTGTTIIIAKQSAEEPFEFELTWIGDTAAFMYCADTESFSPIGVAGRVDSFTNHLEGAIGYGVNFGKCAHIESVTLSKEGDALILATDGIWDVPGLLEDKQAKAAMNNNPLDAARLLTQLATKEYNGNDNASIIVIKLVSRRPKDTSQ